MLALFRSAFRIVVVCRANVTRSPLVAALLRAEFRRRQGTLTRRVKVESAGIEALAGAPPNPVIATIAFHRGLDLRGHRARPLTADLVRRASLILTLEAAQRQALATAYPDAALKIYAISVYGREPGAEAAGDLLDPTGLAEGEYEEFLRRAEVEAARVAVAVMLREGL